MKSSASCVWENTGLKDRTFRVCLMNEQNAGADNIAKPDAEVKYSGKEVTVSLAR